MFGIWTLIPRSDDRHGELYFELHRGVSGWSIVVVISLADTMNNLDLRPIQPKVRMRYST